MTGKLNPRPVPAEPVRSRSCQLNATGPMVSPVSIHKATAPMWWPTLCRQGSWPVEGILDVSLFLWPWHIFRARWLVHWSLNIWISAIRVASILDWPRFSPDLYPSRRYDRRHTLLSAFLIRQKPVLILRQPS